MHTCRQEEIVPFFQGVTLSKESTNTADCYRELSDKVRQGLGHIDPYFSKLADGMLAWLDCWQALSSSGSSSGSGSGEHGSGMLPGRRLVAAGGGAGAAAGIEHSMLANGGGGPTAAEMGAGRS